MKKFHLLNICFILISSAVFPSIAIPVQGHMNFDSPKKQMANGIAANNVICPWEFTLISKSSSESVACVKMSTSVKLQERGWGTILESVSPDLIDDFTPSPLSSNIPYSLEDGDISPNSLWENKYNGYGASGTRLDLDGNFALYEYPMVATEANNTHANMIETTSKWKNFALSLDVRTDKPLRQNDPPNSWEVAWVFFRIVDPWHAYYFILKTDGIELGKSDNDDQRPEQIFLYTADTPTVEIGKWSHWDINMIDNHITIFVDNEKVVDYYDESMSDFLGNAGTIGLYNEDAEVSFDNVIVIPIITDNP